MEVKMLRHVNSWYCECCGGISDETLTVKVDGQVVGVYHDDGHFGYSHIVDAEVEADIATAVGAQEEYATLLAQRDELEQKLAAALEAAKTEEEEDVAYREHGATPQEFSAWLAALGHTVLEENTEECDMSAYDDDYYGEGGDESGNDGDDSDTEGEGGNVEVVAQQGLRV
jgi:HD superfamily phosphohydrolase